MARSLLAVALAVVATCVVATAAAGSGSEQGTPAGGGGAVPSCAAKLVPCAGYLNATTTPPADCCGPLKEAAANETACMCAMLRNTAALQAFGVSPGQGMGLAKRCGVTADASACATAAGAGTGGATAASSASTGGSASPGTKPTNTANGGGSNQHRLGLAGFISLVWWAIVA